MDTRKIDYLIDLIERVLSENDRLVAQVELIEKIAKLKGLPE